MQLRSFKKLTGICRFMLIYANEKTIMTCIFPEIGKIDKTQLILDRSGPVLKSCKIPTASINCKMLRFFSFSLSKAADAYSIHSKNSAILTKFSDSKAEIVLMCKTLQPYSS